jgi:hypothetical protein
MIVDVSMAVDVEKTIFKTTVADGTTIEVVMDTRVNVITMEHEPDRKAGSGRGFLLLHIPAKFVVSIVIAEPKHFNVILES